MRIFQVDAFTSTRFGGNPATVVLDADGQSDAVMASIAREFSHAEVAFVSAATAPDHDLRLRFFNARKEAPFVGHATLAAHAVLLALGRRGRRSVAASERHRNHRGQGHRRTGTAGPLFEFRQTVPDLENPLPLKTTLRVAEALRLPATSLDEMMPARIARKGSSRLLVPVGNARALEGLAPNFETLLELGHELGAEGFFVFAVTGAKRAASAAQGMSTESRMFCPALGINEDPASGNAHVMLASYLFEMGQIGLHQSGFLGLQGRHMQRPSEIHVRLERERSALIAAHIGGHAVLVSEGTLAGS